MTSDPFAPYTDLKSEPALTAEFKVDPGWRYALARRALFGELDALSHLNHTTFLRYFEDARLGYMRLHGLDAPDPNKPGCVLARLEVQYSAPVFFDERVLVTVRASRLGNSSLDLEYAAWTAEHGCACSCMSVIVLATAASGEKFRIPDDMRRSMAEFEGREF